MSFSEVNFNIDTVREIAGSYAGVVNEYKEQIGSFIGRIVKPIQENPVLAVTAFIVGTVALVGVYAFGKYVKNLQNENAELAKTINLKDQEIAARDTFFQEMNRAGIEFAAKNEELQNRNIKLLDKHAELLISIGNVEDENNEIVKDLKKEIKDLKNNHARLIIDSEYSENTNKETIENLNKVNNETIENLKKLQEEKDELSAKLSIVDKYLKHYDEESYFNNFEANHKNVEDVNKNETVSNGGGFLSAIFNNAFTL